MSMSSHNRRSTVIDGESSVGAVAWLSSNDHYECLTSYLSCNGCSLHAWSDTLACNFNFFGTYWAGAQEIATKALGRP